MRGPFECGVFISVMVWLNVFGRADVPARKSMQLGMRKADAPGKALVQLGVSGQYYALLPYSADAAAFIDKYCQ